MAKVKNKVITSFLVGTMLLGSVSGLFVVTRDTKVAYAVKADSYGEGDKSSNKESQALKNARAKVNHLVKSMQTYYLGIKNAETWRDYLNIANFYLLEYGSGGGIFDKQYKELAVRKVKAEAVVKGIEDKFQVEYDAVVKLFNEAKAANDKEKAKLVLTEAENLGTCTRSDNLERDIKNFINY